MTIWQLYIMKLAATVFTLPQNVESKTDSYIDIQTHTSHQAQFNNGGQHQQQRTAVDCGRRWQSEMAVDGGRWRQMAADGGGWRRMAVEGEDLMEGSGGMDDMVVAE